MSSILNDEELAQVKSIYKRMVDIKEAIDKYSEKIAGNMDGIKNPMLQAMHDQIAESRISELPSLEEFVKTFEDLHSKSEVSFNDIMSFEDMKLNALEKIMKDRK